LRCFGSPNTEVGSRLRVADFSFAIASDNLLELKLRVAVVEKWPTRVFEISGTVRVRAAAEPVLPSRIVCPSENRKYAPNPSYFGTYHDSGSYAVVRPNH
jgi:hypothetical protein